MSQKLKDTLWWVFMVVYSVFMLIFTINGGIPGWFSAGSVTAIAIIRLVINQAWKPPESP